MNLQKELGKEAKQQRKIYSDPVLDTTKLLEQNSAQDRELLRAAGLKNFEDISKRSVIGKKIELEKNDEKYSGNVFTLSEIENIALKYRLRFLKTAHYNGHIDAELSTKIKNFAESAGLSIDRYGFQESFFILAPAVAFNLQEKPKPQPIDPILFYKIDQDHYKLIHQWGSDLSWSRIPMAFVLRTANHFWMTAAVITMILLSLSYAFDSIVFLAFALIFAAAICVFRAVTYEDMNLYSDKIWDTPYK